MLVIGLTGGIGSGKSTVANLFAEKGVTVIDTDQLARDLTLPGQVAWHQIVAKWGESILLPDQSLNRAKLRSLIFADPQKRRWLEQLLHPLIRETMQRLLAVATSPYCVVVIPLLLETAPNPLINRILVVDATEEQQIQRAKMRDTVSEAEIKAIIDTQATREQRLAVADDVIYNQGTLEELGLEVAKMHQFYLSSFSQ